MQGWGSSRRGSRRREDGAQAVEFALVLPILLLVVFGIITFGLIFAQQLMMDNAVRQGARYGAVADRTCTDILTETRNNVSGGLVLNPETVGIVVKRGGATVCSGDSSVKPCAGSTVGQNVEVLATYSSNPIVPMVLTGPIELSATGTFRCEFS